MRDEDWIALHRAERDRRRLNRAGWFFVCLAAGIMFVAWLNAPPSLTVQHSTVRNMTER